MDTYEFEHDCLNVSHAYKRLLSLRIACAIIKRFALAQDPLNARQLTDELDIPIRLVREILFELTEVGILSELKDPEDRQSSFQPARDINILTVQYVIEAVDKKGTDKIPVIESKELLNLNKTLMAFDHLIKGSSINKLLKDI